MEFLQEWDWLGWVVMGLFTCWYVLDEAYDLRGQGQGREKEEPEEDEETTKTFDRAW